MPAHNVNRVFFDVTSNGLRVWELANRFRAVRVPERDPSPTLSHVQFVDFYCVRHDSNQDEHRPRRERQNENPSAVHD